MALSSENSLSKWTAPECPFTIEYSPRVLDDIRLAVTDAFFSLPRGGAEIGGLLLGRHEAGRVAILDSMPMECEHAFGPSFVLSEKDHAKLAELVATAARNPSLKPVGWWHSHTRSDIFLSDADQQIHKNFFSEPWQVALVLKPHTFQPTRAGFFFRAPDGSMHGESSYREIVLDPLPMRPAGQPAPPPVAESPGPRLDPATIGRVINISGFGDRPATAEAEPAAAPEEAPAEIAPPSFLAAAAPPREPRRWLGWVAAAAGVTLAIAGYATRDRWLPASAAHPAPAEAVSLNALDHEGQLQIRWNGAASAVRSASAGELVIVDGGATVEVPLDHAHVQSGSFTYARRSEKVDVTLALTEAGGKESRVATLFTGAAVPQPHTGTAPAPADDNLRAERDQARAENAALQQTLAKQAERNKLLDKALEELRKVVERDQQRKRLEAQSPDAGK